MVGRYCILQIKQGNSVTNRQHRALWIGIIIPIDLSPQKISFPGPAFDILTTCNVVGEWFSCQDQVSRLL